MKVLCDFDGTVAKNDVGYLLFRKFADNGVEDVINLWKTGQISSKECLMEECRIARVTRQELEAFTDAQPLDAHFKSFVQFCRTQKIAIEIVSDGLDFYIERILKNHHLYSGFEVHANHLKFVDQNQIEPEFPYFEAGCGHCANCKGLHVRNAREQHDTVIYVGDGLSDRCGAEEADIVFAKTNRDLLRHCQQNQIPHHPFEHFGQVRVQLEKILKHDVLIKK